MEHNGKVAAWYNANVDFEDNRLDLGRLEYTITLRTITQTLSRKHETGVCTIADIGCGTGKYAIKLAKLGHRVSVADISSGELALANEKAQAANVSFDYSAVIDAVHLRDKPELYRPAHYDAVLLLGPLYHLVDEKDRLSTLRACVEMTKPGGYVFAAFVTKYSHLRNLPTRDPERLFKEPEFYKEYLETGNYERATLPVMHHTDVDEIHRLISSLQASGVSISLERLLGTEGFLGLHHGKPLTTLNDDAFGAWVDVIERYCDDPSALGASDHLLAVIKCLL